MNNTLVSLAKAAAVIVCLKPLGRATPRVNIQNDKGKAKAYQVRQVLLAIEKLELKS